MAYTITKGMFPADIVSIIVSFLDNPKKERWAKYWRGESVKLIENIFHFHLYYYGDLNKDSLNRHLEWIKDDEYSAPGHIEKYLFIFKDIVNEINDLNRLSRKERKIIKKLYSRIFINNGNKAFGTICSYCCKYLPHYSRDIYH